MTEASACAAMLVETIPHLMQEMRQSMRGARGDGLSVPQFRSLARIAQHPGASLSEVAAHVGLGAPAMSVIVDGLVRRKLIARTHTAGDRRRRDLVVTEAGQAVLCRVRTAATQDVAQRLKALPANDLSTIATAMRLLIPLFSE